MSLTETMLEGTLKPDGTLDLDRKPNLPAGRVSIVLRSAQESDPASPFWRRMQAMWAIPISNANAADGGASACSEVRLMREEWDERQQAIEKLQEQCRAVQPLTEERKP